MSGSRAVGGEFPLEDGRAPAERSLRHRIEELSAPGRPVLLASGREALRAWLRDAGARGRDRLVVPSYICGAVLEAAKGTGICWLLHLVPVDECLAPRPDDLAAAAAGSDAERTCLVAAPLFGEQYPRATLTAIREAERAGAEVCWDVTHGLLSRWADTAGPIRVASMRKWCGLPDGALLTGVPIDEPAPMSGSDPFLVERLEGMKARGRWLRAGHGSEDDFLVPLRRAEAGLSVTSEIRGMSLFSRGLLGAVNVGTLAQARQRNARTLLASLRGDAGTVIPFLRPVEDGVVPLCVPILCDDRDALRRRLAGQRIFAPVHWDLPAEVAADVFPHEHAMSSRILSLPCDQRLDDDDLRRVAHTVALHAARGAEVSA